MVKAPSDKGCHEVMHESTLCYKYGIGMKVNVVKALALIIKASGGRYGNAFCHFGIIHEEGGVENVLRVH